VRCVECREPKKRTFETWDGTRWCAECLTLIRRLADIKRV
jgi:hypothetical protein